MQHGSKGDLHVEADQPAPGEEADPAEVVHKEETRGANLSHVVEECQYEIIKMNQFVCNFKYYLAYNINSNFIHEMIAWSWKTVSS